MARGLLSLRNRFAFGNAAIGLCLVSLGVIRLFDSSSLLALGASVLLLLTSVAAFLACFSSRREMPDEMSEAHDGVAAGHALRITLIVAGVLCVACMITNVKIDFASAALGLIGFGLLAYGAIFGWLER